MKLDMCLHLHLLESSSTHVCGTGHLSRCEGIKMLLVALYLSLVPAVEPGG